MAGWSGGSVSFSGGPYTYNVSYSAPTYTYPSNATSVTSGSNSAPSSVSCGSSASKTYWVRYFWTTVGEWIDSETTISGTAPSCPPPPTYPPSWSDNTLAGFQADVAYSDGVTATNMNYSGSYSVSSGSLPSGISLNASTGAVTGTPTTAGQSYSFTITATNSYGSVAQAFSGTVAASPTAGKLKVWTGTTWVYAPAKVWNGTSWVTGTVKVWNGTTWVTSV
jgi:hypothetical protein